MVSPMFIVGSIAGWVMVTRPATSGKGKFVPQTRTTVPYNHGGRTAWIWLARIEYLYVVKVSSVQAKRTSAPNLREGAERSLISSTWIRENRRYASMRPQHRRPGSLLCCWDSRTRVRHHRRS